MAAGGKRQGAGRPRGRQNKKTEMLQASMTEASQALPEDYTSLVLFQAVYRNCDLPPQLRLYAASQAIPYEHKKQPTETQVSGKEGAAAIQVTLVDFVEASK